MTKLKTDGELDELKGNAKRVDEDIKHRHQGFREVAEVAAVHFFHH